MNKIAKLMSNSNAADNARPIADEVIKLVKEGHMGAPELEEILRFMYSAGMADICNFMSDGVEDYQAELHFSEEKSREDMKNSKEYIDKLAVSSAGYKNINDNVIKMGVMFMSQFI